MGTPSLTTARSKKPFWKPCYTSRLLTAGDQNAEKYTRKRHCNDSHYNVQHVGGAHLNRSYFILIFSTYFLNFKCKGLAGLGCS
ncbi:unnamed protein product [Larinioides sclopetarius]|uniref:Uncharacterized protein n=1 Tax=Larinioides sclopetarius TaxID=280406 RepID=A0AAV1ZHP0_9ARAC